jgi:hypothetical protein
VRGRGSGRPGRRPLSRSACIPCPTPPFQGETIRA